MWHRKPDPKAPKSIVKAKIIPIIITAILLILAIIYVIPPFLIESIPQTDFTIIILFIVCFGILAQLPLFTYIRAKEAEYLITNKRILIKKAAYIKKPWIINFYQVKEGIDVKYNKSKGTGTIFIPISYIPNPIWDRNTKDQIIFAEIKDIKDPYKVYNILIEAIAIGKSTKWQYDEDPIFK